MKDQPAGSDAKGDETPPQDPDRPVVVMETSKGTFEIELDRKNAPISTNNFCRYVRGGFYDGLIFHRVISNFMIQGGGYTMDLYENAGARPKTPRAAIKNEADNGLKNKRGTIAMARTQDVDSATSQFFINVVDNPGLDHQGERSFGYAVFGKVIKGMEVVDAIRNAQVSRQGPHAHLPAEPIQVVKATIQGE